jgi:predicted RNA-binding Zn-ribbon protein involved in translation (DUF1610 family)
MSNKSDNNFGWVDAFLTAIFVLYLVVPALGLPVMSIMSLFTGGGEAYIQICGIATLVGIALVIIGKAYNKIERSKNNSDVALSRNVLTNTSSRRQIIYRVPEPKEEALEFQCSHCGAPATQEDQHCRRCGSLFSEELFCSNHPSVHAEGVCVICSKPFCKQCGKESNRIFHCDAH